MDTSNTSQDEAQIRQIILEWSQAVRAKDLDKITEHYAEDVLVCDVVPPLRYTGTATYREHCKGWFAGWNGPIECDIHVEQLHNSGGVAFAVCLTHNWGTHADGSTADMWLRVTVGFAKREEQWLVVHEHVSVPVDMETGHPRFDLQPL